MRVAFIVDQFPSLSTTFILNQITGLLDKGHDVTIYSKYRTKEMKVHSEVSQYNLLDRVVYFDVPRNMIKRALTAIYLLAANFPRSPKKIFKALNVFKYSRLPLTLTFTYIYALIPFLKKKYDIIHCQFGTNGNLGAVLKQLGVQSLIICTFRGYDLRLGLKKGGHIFKRLFKHVDCLMSNSDYAYDILLKLGADPRKTIIHPSGIDVHKFSFKWKTEGIESPSPIIILTVARLAEIKGLQYAIQAIHNLHQKRPELRLEYRIIGGGPLESELKALIKDLDLNKVVRFLGPMEQEEVLRNLREAHIFLLTSLAESLGVATIEAQAVGLPVIASSVGDLPKMVKEGKSGFLVPPRNVAGFTERLEYLIDHPDIWPEMGRTGRKHVEKNYDIDNLNDRLIEIYRNLLK